MSKGIRILQFAGTTVQDPTQAAYIFTPIGVEYEEGHTESGMVPANVGAMRAFFDFILHAGIARSHAIHRSSFPRCIHERESLRQEQSSSRPCRSICSPGLAGADGDSSKGQGCRSARRGCSSSNSRPG